MQVMVVFERGSWLVSVRSRDWRLALDEPSTGTASGTIGAAVRTCVLLWCSPTGSGPVTLVWASTDMIERRALPEVGFLNRVL